MSSPKRELRSGRTIGLKPKSEEKAAQPRPPKNKKVLSELEIALAKSKERAIICDKSVTVEDLKRFDRDLKYVFDDTKRGIQAFQQKTSSVKRLTNRSGKRRIVQSRGHQHQGDYTNGRLVNKGMDDVREKFDEEEQEYLKNAISKIQSVDDLKYEHLRYLIVYVFLDDLKAIKEGKLKSDFHDLFQELRGKSQQELQSEVRTTLFTNEQRDYISGALQELFDANKKDELGDFRYDDMSYVRTVIMAEATIRIVKYVHKFETIDETVEFMKKKAREAYGISDDEDD